MNFVLFFSTRLLSTMGDSLRHRTEWTPSQRKRHQPVEERFFSLDWTYPTPQLNTSCRLIYNCSITSSREQIERIVMLNLGLIWVYILCLRYPAGFMPGFIPGQSFSKLRNIPSTFSGCCSLHSWNFIAKRTQFQNLLHCVAKAVFTT